MPTDHRHRALEVLAGQRGKRQPGGHALPNAHRIALERVHGQPQRRQIADAECGRRRVEHLTDDCGSLDHRAGDRRPQDERRRGGIVGLVCWRLHAECGNRGTGRAQCGARFTGCRFGFLHFPERDDLLSGQRTLALERRVSKRQARAGREVLRSLASEFGAGQFGKRLTAANGVTGIHEQARDSRRDRRADFGVRALIHRQLAQQQTSSPPAGIRPAAW